MHTYLCVYIYINVHTLVCSFILQYVCMYFRVCMFFRSQMPELRIVDFRVQLFSACQGLRALGLGAELFPCQQEAGPFLS